MNYFPIFCGITAVVGSVSCLVVPAIRYKSRYYIENSFVARKKNWPTSFVYFYFFFLISLRIVVMLALKVFFNKMKVLH